MMTTNRREQTAIRRDTDADRACSHRSAAHGEEAARVTRRFAGGVSEKGEALSFGGWDLGGPRHCAASVETPWPWSAGASTVMYSCQGRPVSADSRFAASIDMPRSPFLSWQAYGTLNPSFSANSVVESSLASAYSANGFVMAIEFAYRKLRVKGVVCRLYNDNGFADCEYAGCGYPGVSMKRTHYLKEWREFRKLTQEQLADLVRTDKSVISLLESEGRGLSAKWAHRLAAALKINPGWLLDYNPFEMSGDIIEIWSTIPESSKVQAREILQTFRKAVGA